MSTFGERLRTLRRASGLSQGELAGDEMSASYVSLLEAGKRSPSDAVIQLMADRLGCSSSQLLEGRPSERDQRIDLEMAYARLAIEHGESPDARDRLERLLTEDALPPAVRHDATLLLATALQRLGDNADAVRLLLPLLDAADAGHGVASVLDVGQNLARSYLDHGDLHRAVWAGERALAIARRHLMSDTTEYFRLAATVVAAYLAMGDFLHARTMTDAFIARAEETGQIAGQAVLYWNAGVAAELEGRLDDALRFCERALGRLGELDNLRDYARLRNGAAQLLLVFDEPRAAEARALLTACLPDLRDHGSHADHAIWNRSMSIVLLLEGDPVGAEGRARQSLDLLSDSFPDKQALSWMSLSDALTAQGRRREAGDCLARAAEALRQVTGGGRSTALLHRELAERLADAGDDEAAMRSFRLALDAGTVRDNSIAVRTASTSPVTPGPSRRA